jgi:hypothetical protein
LIYETRMFTSSTKVRSSPASSTAMVTALATSPWASVHGPVLLVDPDPASVGVHGHWRFPAWFGGWSWGWCQYGALAEMSGSVERQRA